MAHITGEDRSQLLLLPDAVDDYVGPDNPVRFIDAFAGGLDLETAGFQRVRPNDKGRPGYDPGDLLKLYIYGYLNRIRSSRRLEVETHRNLEVIWLLRQLRPDFKTIADFRRDNRNAFRAVFRQFVRLCRELDLYGRELIAVDGTRIKAVNKRDRNFTRAKLKTHLQRTCDRLDRYLDQMNEADADDAGGRVDAVADLQEKITSLRKRKETLERHRQTLDDTGEAQLSLTDPDSRSMHPGTRVGVGYNVQMAVDTKHNLIAEQQVHSKVSDLGLLAETAAAARENLAVDKIEDIEDCEAAGITPYVPKPDRSTARHSGHFPKSAFQYDAATDTYRCPAGERLLPLYRASVGKSRAGTYLVSYVNRTACRGCGLRETMYQEDLPAPHALRERINDGAHGGPSRRQARGDGPSPGVGRASLRFDQAVDGPRGVPDAPARQCPRGVQPHRLGLQHATRNQPRGNSRLDCRRSPLTG